MPRRIVVEDPELGPLTRDRLTRDYWVYQRLRGHRFSSDDVVTAFVAWHAAPHARLALDLGTGLGSVMLQLAWRLPHATFLGVEAQAASFALLQRNIEENGLASRVRAVHGDLRDLPSSLPHGTKFDLVTGTPPYFPAGTALDADDAQRSYARMEYRGGVEEYCAAGARLVAGDGRLVLCGDSDAEPRIRAAAAELGLTLRATCRIIPRDGRAALFSVWTLAFETGPEQPSELVLRDAAGERTADAERLRAFGGFPPARSGASSGGSSGETPEARGIVSLRATDVG